MTTAIVAALPKAEVEQVNIIYPILVPPLGKLPGRKGQPKLLRETRRSEGPRDLTRFSELAGAAAVRRVP